MKSLPFIEGFAPIQLLLEVAILVGTLGLISHHLEKRGFRANKFFQATGLLALAIAYLKYRVYPPMPFSTLAIYTVTIAIGIFVWVSSTEGDWKSFCGPILAVIDGTTRTTRLARILVLVLLPILVSVLGYNIFKTPPIETPVELRTHFPAPPASIKVHGETFNLQEAQNPFRVDGQGNYLKPPSDATELTCSGQFSAFRTFGLCPDQKKVH